MIVFIWTLFSCTEAAVEDYSAVEIDSRYSFDEATLDPPFYHANSLWAGVALLDYDADGWLDIFFSNGRAHPDALYRNNGDGSFSDVAEEAGLASLRENGAVVAGDLDNDGDEDLIVNVPCSATTLSEEGEFLWDGDKILYHNDGNGHFTEQALKISEEFVEHVQHCTFSLLLADMNSDGFLDLVASDGHDPDTVAPWAFDKFHPGGENIIFYNDGAGNFDQVSQTLGTEGSFVATHLDVNSDGRMDLIFGNSGHNITIYIQGENGVFVEEVTASESGRGLWMGLAVADYDRDGVWDIYATNQGLSPFLLGYDNLLYALPNDGIAQYSTLPSLYSSEPAKLLRQWLNPFHSLLSVENNILKLKSGWGLDAPHLLAGDFFTDSDGRYEYWSPADGFQRLPWGWAAVALDVDSDGWMDVAFNGNACAAPMAIVGEEENGAGPGALLINQKGTGFLDKIWSSGIANTETDGRYKDGRGLAVGDLNNDGHPDLVFANRAYNPSDTNPLEQRPGVPSVWLSTPREGNWLQVELMGTVSNRNAIGAEVILRNGDTEFHQWLRAGGAMVSSSQSMLHFGLGNVEEVDLEIIFPSGGRVQRTSVSVNQRLLIEEGS